MTDKRSVHLVNLALLLAVWGLYARAGNFGFVNFDDPMYVSANPALAGGFTWAAVARIFSAPMATNWHPITMLSHLLDVSLFGLAPGPHHLMNVALHSLNAVLLFKLLREATDGFWPSAFAAALFAVHPTRVQSVVWIAERKDVLSMAFGLLALLAYVRATRRPGLRGMAVVGVFLSLGLMAKPILVSLPFLMLILDAWPLGRLQTRGDLWPRIREKAALWALMLIFCVVTMVVQKQAGAMHTLTSIPLGSRAANAAISVARYMGMVVWPVGLSVFYPYQRHLPLWGVAAAVLGIAGITAVAWRARKDRPWLMAGWTWFLISLVPVIGLVQVGMQAMADRYTYLPFVGLFMALAWEARERLKGCGIWTHRIAVGSAAASLLALMCLTWFEVGVWRNSTTLFSHAAQVAPPNYLVQFNLGSALLEERRFAEAAAAYEMANRLDPGSGRLHRSLGKALEGLGRWREAEKAYREALRFDAQDYDSAFRLVHVLAAAGDHPAVVRIGTRFLALEGARTAKSGHPAAEADASAEVRALVASAREALGATARSQQPVTRKGA